MRPYTNIDYMEVMGQCRNGNGNISNLDKK